MIIWVASYPRSGNSLTRQILKQCFGLNSYALTTTNRAGPASHLIGSADFHGPPETLAPWARETVEPRIVKTHLLSDPSPFEKVIYVVRDARPAFVSYRRFQREVNGLDFSLEQMIRGEPPLENWTEHVRWGLNRSAETTLLLHYETLAKPSLNMLLRVASFIGRPIVAQSIASFETVKQVRPKLMQVGENAPGVEEVEVQHSELFWSLHGEMMSAAGYSEARISKSDSARHSRTVPK